MCDTFRSEYQIVADTLVFKQAMKWLLLHEKKRHMDDIQKINKDLEKLQDIELPELPYGLWVEVK